MGQPIVNSDIRILEVYPQSKIILSDQSGAVVLDMSVSSFLTFTLSGDITSISTINNPSSTGGVVINITIIQDPILTYTIDWLISGSFGSNLSSVDLQPPGPGLSAAYQAIWNGSTFELLIDKEFTLPALTEYQQVIARMTNPSVPFQDAIQEYVESEQATLNNNWVLTDEVFMLNADTEVNALLGWKVSNGINNGATYLVWKGFSGDGVSQYIDTGYNQLTDRTVSSRDDVFHSTWIRELVLTASYTNIHGVVASGNKLTPKSDRVIVSVNSTGIQLNTGVALIHSELLATYTRIISSSFDVYFDGVFQLTNGGNSIALNSNENVFLLGGNSSGVLNLPTETTLSYYATGAAIGFDVLSHDISVRRFSDRMLIQKHISTVNTVLDRYTDLTDREIFALSRLVARSEENGNWALLEEVYLLGLFETANVKVGLKQFTADDEFDNIVYTPGYGISGVEATNVRFWTGYIGANSPIAVTDNQNVGGILTLNNKVVAYSGYAHFASNTDNLTVTSAFSLGFQGQGSSIANRAYTDVNLHYIYRTRGVGFTGWDFYENEVLVKTDGGPNAIATAEYCLLNKSYSSSAPMDGVLKLWFVGADTGFNQEEWVIDSNQAVNELEIDKVATVDWDIQDKIYYWNDRKLAADQLEELSSIIVTNSDNTTTGRTFDIQGHLGITFNCQVSLDQLTTDGFVILQ